MNSNSTPLREVAGLLYEEGKRRILLMTALLSVISVAALGIGIVIPKRFDAFTLVSVGSGSAMKPLTENRGVPVGTVEHAAIVLQITEGKKILRELLVFGGWEEPGKSIDPVEEAKLLQKLRSRIKIDAPKEGIIRIGYNDSDPTRTYKMANKLAEIYVRESDESQVRETKEAFDFIDKQANDYGEKLAAVHQEVLAQYAGGTYGGGAAALGSAPRPAPRPLPAPGATLGPQELAALRAEKATLEAQLGPKTATPSPQGTAAPPDQTVAQTTARVRQLETELDGLLAKYTDQHPDVKRVRRELATAKEEQARAIDAARAAAPPARDDRTAALDDQIQSAARARLRQIDQRIAAATGVPYQPTAAARPTEQRDPELRNIGQDTKLSELVRRYEATRDVYQDLLKRRESARVAMDLAAEHRGINLRIQEPAEFPLAATGLRLSHVCMVGMVLGLLVPLAVLFLMVRLDGRVRTAHQVELLAKVPLLVSIHAVPGQTDRSRFRKQRVLAVLMLVAVAAIYVATFIIKTRSPS